jgi:hypothetical protein
MKPGPSIALLVVVACSCSNSSNTHPGGDASTDAPAPAAQGTACVPSSEDMATGAASVMDVSLDTANATCGSLVCLSNHFQGRVSCPYGQSQTRTAPAGAMPCTVPGSGAPVTSAVQAQCTNRKAADTVYCSCRCANTNGRTDDGATYCTCDTGFDCTQLVTSTGSNASQAGGYCMKHGTAFDPANACAMLCGPKTNPCP